MLLLGVSGSLRENSSNTALLRAAGVLAAPAARLELSTALPTLPYFNPDLDAGPPPEPVHRWRAAVGSAAGLLISSPEYAHGIAGVLKNGLDWLVGSTEIVGKPVAILNASPRATHADASLREILRTMGGRPVEAASLTFPLLGRGLDDRGILADPELAALLRATLDGLYAAIGGAAPAGGESA